jgi:hypothetical protein
MAADQKCVVIPVEPVELGELAVTNLPRCAKAARIDLPVVLAFPTDAVAIDKEVLWSRRKVVPVTADREQDTTSSGCARGR